MRLGLKAAPSQMAKGIIKSIAIRAVLPIGVSTCYNILYLVCIDRCSNMYTKCEVYVSIGLPLGVPILIGAWYPHVRC